ncbi:MAG: HAD family acid phosphatase [Candidatus Rokubacteria bacterium]|nr:HAD family acid phosphatase [Candidatus Rokubacteria bacterium]
MRRAWPAAGSATWLAAALLLAAGCAGAPPARVPDLWEVKRELTEYVASGRYEAGVAAVAGEARAHLAERARAGGKLALVLDIDETSLSNLIPLQASDYGRIIDGPCDLPRGPCGMLAWIRLARAPALAPVAELAATARERGVAVFFISGRPESVRAPTEQNLRAQGFEWTAVLLQPDGFHSASAVAFKAPARQRIIAQGYAIIANVGDQWSDLDGGYAERTFKLPNPFYFIP